MKHKKIGFKKFLAGVLVLALFGVLSMPTYGSGDVCYDALEKCAVQAIMAGMFGGMNSFASYASGCFIGYDWCLKYYVPLK